MKCFYYVYISFNWDFHLSSTEFFQSKEGCPGNLNRWLNNADKSIEKQRNEKKTFESFTKNLLVLHENYEGGLKCDTKVNILERF